MNKKELEEENRKLRTILASIMPDKLPGPFICGRGSEPSSDGLSDRYHICPTYGSDVVVAYERVRKSDA